MIIFMILPTFLVGLSLLFLVVDTQSTEDSINGHNENESAFVVESNVTAEEEVHAFATPELDPSVYDSPFPTDLTTPLSYIEGRELLITLREEKLEEYRYEREQALLAHVEAMEELEAERVAKEEAIAIAKAEAEQAEAERVAQEKEQAEQEALAIAQAQAEEERAIAEAKEESEAKETPAPQTKQESKPELEEQQQVQTASTPEPVESKPQANSQVSSSHLLAQLVESEAKGEPYTGKVAVAEVVLARVNSSEFPNSIEGVIYQPGQFQVVSNGSINNAPSQESINASNEALAGSNYTNGALFFYNPRIATDRWQDTLRTTAVIGNHTFKAR